MLAINKPDKTVVMPDIDLVTSHDSPDVIVSEKRRRLAKFALGAPVLVTLASRPCSPGRAFPIFCPAISPTRIVEIVRQV